MITAVVITLALLVLIWLGTGCKHYSERVIFLNPDGSTNATASANYTTFLIAGKAANLQTYTHMPGYIRTVGADAVTTEGDATTVTALGTSVGNVVSGAAGLPKLGPAPRLDNE